MCVLRLQTCAEIRPPPLTQALSFTSALLSHICCMELPQKTAVTRSPSVPHPSEWTVHHPPEHKQMIPPPAVCWWENLSSTVKLHLNLEKPMVQEPHYLSVSIVVCCSCCFSLWTSPLRVCVSVLCPRWNVSLLVCSACLNALQDCRIIFSRSALTDHRFDPLEEEHPDAKRWTVGMFYWSDVELFLSSGHLAPVSQTRFRLNQD